MINDITLEALIAYTNECQQQIRKASNVEEAKFWQQRSIAAKNQADEIRQLLNSKKTNLKF
jgi:hypothetical protein